MVLAALESRAIYNKSNLFIYFLSKCIASGHLGLNGQNVLSLAERDLKKE